MNIARNVISIELSEYILDCIKQSYRYFSQPRNCTFLTKTEQAKVNKKSEDVNNAGNIKCLEPNDGDVRPKAPNVEETLASNTLASHEGMRTGAEPTVATCDHDDYEERSNDVESNVEYNHMFQFSSLTDGKGPPICCLFCKKEGHLKDSCPDEKLPDLNQLPKFTRSHKEMLNWMLKEIPNVTVHLFGFGVTLTCVTFDSHKTREGHFFNQKYLTPDGPSPKDGCCTICNKIVHLLKDCPVRKQRYQRYY